MLKQIELIKTVHRSQFGQRLDQAITKLLRQYSRSQIKNWILKNQVQVNGKIANKPKTQVLGGELITICVQIEEPFLWKPQDIALNVIYEDSDILVINKPRDQAVHPGAGNPDGTTLNALLYYLHPKIIDVPRAGIVHRLDKNTTGLMVVAKTIQAHNLLTKALKSREITREYEAVVIGAMTSGGTVDEPIGRHSVKRIHMAVRPTGKESVTHYRIMEHFRAHTRLRLRLETGRTHQIRVHMSHINHPLVGDPLYGGRPRPPKGSSEILIRTLCNFTRQALHSSMLSLYHPISGIKMEWHALLAEDMTKLINALKADTKEFQNKKDW